MWPLRGQVCDRKSSTRRTHEKGTREDPQPPENVGFDEHEQRRRCRCAILRREWWERCERKRQGNSTERVVQFFDECKFINECEFINECKSSNERARQGNTTSPMSESRANTLTRLGMRECHWTGSGGRNPHARKLRCLQWVDRVALYTGWLIHMCIQGCIVHLHKHVYIYIHTYIHIWVDLLLENQVCPMVVSYRSQ